MNSSWFRAIMACAALQVSIAKAEEAHWHCAQASAFAPATSQPPSGRQYAPSREVDVLHLALDVTPDFQQRTVSGTATWKFKPIAQPLAELRLDGVDLSVAAVTSSERVLGYQVTADKVIVTFAEPVPAGKETTVSVRYSAEPRKGLYFRTPELGYDPEDLHIWTQGEPHEAPHWYPCYDYPNEKFTVEVTCRVPEGIVALSNGRKVSEEKDSNGLLAVRWLQDKPMVNYLVALVAGKLKFIEDKHRDISMRFWTPTTEIEQAMNSFRDTKDMMVFFEKEIGVPYPWAKYDQVCIQDYHWGGMENTTLTTLNILTLFPSEFENLRSSQGLVAHELAHQWFGDLITCKDWSHLWLNEGFASYYDALYTEHKQGRDEFLYRMYELSKSLTEPSTQEKSIVWRKYGEATEQFDSLAYGKGAFVLHMLRSQLGPDLYRQCVKAFVEKHQYGTVVTEDFREVIEELSGRSFDQFFDQWVYHAGFPVLDVDYSWDERAKLAKLTVRQTQQTNERVLLFQFPLPVRFTLGSSTIERVLNVSARSEDFFVPLPEQPRIVRVDPEVSVLARTTFRAPNAMQAAMLANKKDIVGQLIACERFGERRDAEAVKKLKETLNGDASWPVRVAASRGLRAINNDTAFDALLASQKQSDARVRKQVVSDVTGFYRQAAFDRAREVVRTEKNPEIIATALTALAPLGTNVRPVLLAYLNTNSWRQHLSDSAMATMRSQNDPFYVEPLLESLKRRRQEFHARTLSSGLDILAYLARERENKDAVREFISSFVNDSRQNVRLAAIRALGTLRDERATPVLERVGRGSAQSLERRAAEQSVEALRAARKNTLEVGDVRREVLDLQRQNRDLRSELDTLKKRIEGITPARK